jgi:hypothetical protein
MAHGNEKRKSFHKPAAVDLIMETTAAFWAMV